MAYERGDIVIIGFPFSDLSRKKKRPALIISNNTVNNAGDYLMVQITSKFHDDHFTIPLQKDDFADKKELPLRSYIRMHKIFLLNENLILTGKTAVTRDFLDRVVHGIIEIIT